MRRPDAIRLVETPHAARRGGAVIDAKFTVVQRPSVLGRIKRYVLALLTAALIGALIPPAFALVRYFTS